MWRRLGRCDALTQSISVAVGRRPLPSPQSPQMMEGMIVRTSPAFRGGLENLTSAEAKKLMRLVNVESLKTKLEMEGKGMDVARSLNEAIAFARVLDEAGVVLVFRDKIYLHPEKTQIKLEYFVQANCSKPSSSKFHFTPYLNQTMHYTCIIYSINHQNPSSLLFLFPNPSNKILHNLPLVFHAFDNFKSQRFLAYMNISFGAHKEVRHILWTGLGLAVGQVGLFFRLTFWEFSWDVMEPITYFSTSIIIVICYAYFLFTSRDPTYQDLMKRLVLSRQRKLFLNHNFDLGKLKALQNKCKTPLDASASV
ncbi:hypothetical protein V6Z11_D10G000300 [Gossypium hirsutum]